MIEKKRPIAMLWEISYGSRALYAASCAAMLASVFCGFLLPQVIRFVVDGVAGEADAGGISVLLSDRVDASGAEGGRK